MQALNLFFPRLLPYAPGCSEPLAAQALLDSAIEFCDLSQVLRDRLPTFSSAIGVSAYPLVVDTQQEVSSILRVWAADRELAVAPTSDIQHSVAPLAPPSQAYTTRYGSVFALNLYPTPVAIETILVDASLRPRRGAATVDDDLLNYWVEPVVQGALARILLMPDQPFYNPVMAERSARMARQGTSKARIDSDRGRVRAAVRITPRPFA